MQKNNTAVQAGKLNKLADWPIRTLILSMGMPMVLSMVLQAVYNIVDTIFVSHMENGATAALALTDSYSIQLLIVAVGVGTGIGINALLSKTLGERNFEKASCIAGNGIFLAVCIYALGGGLIEVLISPIVESCPTDNKEKAMSLLHSFYCWGHVGVVLLSTIFFSVFGIVNWKILACIWALVPVLNACLFVRTPIAPLIEEGETGMSMGELFCSKVFWLMMLMMLCAGASEQAVSQWASTFAEKGLGVTKTIGDLAGPMLFAILMGSSRAFYGKAGHRMDLDRFMLCSSVLCILSYLLIVFSPLPVFSLVGCGICGLSVGIMWPGTFSKASSALRRGGTAMFALLALAGDLGCSGGPTLVGAVASAASDNLKIGILVAIIFPVVMALGVCLCKKKKYPGLV